MKNLYPRIIIAGTHSGVGKTTITAGLISVFKRRSLAVQPYKTGPDYIDPGFHSEAAGRPCRNLDTMLLSRPKILELFARHSQDADISLIEGVMGLFDGASAANERGSSSHLSKLLRCPVLLIIDAHAMARSAGAVALGYNRFERNLRIAGIIFNRIGSERHYEIVKQAVEKKTRVPVLGYLSKNEQLRLPERHLGLVPAWEADSIGTNIRQIAEAVEKKIDLNRILKIARSAPAFPEFTPAIYKAFKTGTYKPVRIAYALDDAFHFYYHDNLEILNHFGAECVPFSPLEDSSLPGGVSAVYIGGGFPEVVAERLSGNSRLIRDLKEKADQGMPVYAECGGFIYLVEQLLTAEGKQYKMAGLLPGEIRMGRKLHSLGYCEARLLKDTIIGRAGMRIKGHIFHWSYLVRSPRKEEIAFILRKDSAGPPAESCGGLARKNVLAGYLHIHFGTKPSCAKYFLNSARRYGASDESQGN